MSRPKLRAVKTPTTTAPPICHLEHIAETLKDTTEHFDLLQSAICDVVRLTANGIDDANDVVQAVQNVLHWHHERRCGTCGGDRAGCDAGRGRSVSTAAKAAFLREQIGEIRSLLADVRENYTMNCPDEADDVLHRIYEALRDMERAIRDPSQPETDVATEPAQ